MDTICSIGSPKRICFMIEENGRTLLIAPYAQKDFKSHEVSNSVYAGSSSLEINSLRLCSLVAKLHGGTVEGHTESQANTVQNTMS